MKFSAKIRGRARAFLVIITLITLLAVACSPDFSDSSDISEPGEKPFSEEVLLKGHLFELELALIPVQRAIGLMGRRSLPDDRGMLFVYFDADS